MDSLLKQIIALWGMDYARTNWEEILLNLSLKKHSKPKGARYKMDLTGEFSSIDSYF
jgi:hypothetical protein